MGVFSALSLWLFIIGTLGLSLRRKMVSFAFAGLAIVGLALGMAPLMSQLA
jgi:hypothetical protein